MRHRHLGRCSRLLGHLGLSRFSRCETRLGDALATPQEERSPITSATGDPRPAAGSSDKRLRPMDLIGAAVDLVVPCGSSLVLSR